MPSDRLMRIHSPEFQAMADRVLRATELTSRLNVLPFEDEDGKAALFAQILGRPLPPRTTVYPPFFTDHGLRLDLADRVFINQNCTFLDYAGIRLDERVMVGPRATFITSGHPVDPEERRHYLTGGPIHVQENVWIGAGADPAGRHHRQGRGDRGRRGGGRGRPGGDLDDRSEGGRTPPVVRGVLGRHVDRPPGAHMREEGVGARWWSAPMSSTRRFPAPAW